MLIDKPAGSPRALLSGTSRGRTPRASLLDNNLVNLHLKAVSDGDVAGALLLQGIRFFLDVFFLDVDIIEEAAEVKVT